MSNATIIGLGWLGSPLANHLKTKGLTVTGTVSSKSKADNLQKQGIDARYFSTEHPQTFHVISDIINTDIIVITIPFKRSLKDPLDYLSQISVIVDAIPKDRHPHILFTSSTSVYPEQLQTCTESLVFDPRTLRQTALLATENKILSHKNSSVLRLAGLIGPNREPGNWMHKPRILENPKKPMNLVWQEDCLAVIDACIQQRAFGIFNVCADEHPTRQTFYSEIAAKKGLNAPVFTEGKTSIQKVVSNEKSKRVLGHSYQSILPRFK